MAENWAASLLMRSVCERVEEEVVSESTRKRERCTHIPEKMLAYQKKSLLRSARMKKSVAKERCL